MQYGDAFWAIASAIFGFGLAEVRRYLFPPKPSNEVLQSLNELRERIPTVQITEKLTSNDLYSALREVESLSIELSHAKQKTDTPWGFVFVFFAALMAVSISPAWQYGIPVPLSVIWTIAVLVGMGFMLRGVFQNVKEYKAYVNNRERELSEKRSALITGKV